MYDGGSMTSPMIGEYCDSLPSSLISSSNRLFIRFYSDFSFTGTGFKLQYNATSKSLGHFVSAKLRQPTGQSQDNFNFGPSLLKGVFSKSSGDYIVVPNFCFLR